MAAATAAGAAAAAAAVSLITCYLLFHNSILKVPSARKARTSCASGRRTRRRGLVEAIGNTPLVRINSLSDATGCEVGMWGFYLFFSALLPEQVLEVGELQLFFLGLQILGKAEFLNPGGSVKDRVAVKIIEEVTSAILSRSKKK